MASTTKYNVRSKGLINQSFLVSLAIINVSNIPKHSSTIEIITFTGHYIDGCSGGSRISCRGGMHPLGGHGPPMQALFGEMYVKMKELSLIGGGVRPARPLP